MTFSITAQRGNVGRRATTRIATAASRVPCIAGPPSRPRRAQFSKECIMENPFGDAEEPAVGHRQYLVLIAASKDNASLAQKQLENLKKYVDDRAAPLWIDAKGIGVLLTTDMVASEIWRAMFQKDAGQDLGDTRNMLVLELGKDWAARRDDKIEHWLATHVGNPLPPMPRAAGKKR
ncbi:hypothetical protein [Achromobacter piechaudii]|nr:hypothetical protein [Achromobacter piechaudii]